MLTFSPHILNVCKLCSEDLYDVHLLISQSQRFASESDKGCGAHMYEFESDNRNLRANAFQKLNSSAPQMKLKLKKIERNVF